mmetsp:Transcript_10761/g.10659  ORF Transcript_10761/g.10659 Transcript_10761/m.10659 type:complete len:210 (-) Transcript_10761:34-663(-)
MARYEVGENNRIDLRRLSSSNLSFYKKAHDLLMTQVIISSESLPQKFSDLQLMIEKLEKNKEYISNWENNGRILYEFLRLRADSIGYLSTFFDNYGEYAPVEEQWKNSNTQEEITKLQARLSALVKSFENFCQFEVSQNMTSMKTELKRILLDWDTKFKIINAKLNDNHINLSFPNDLLLDSQDLNICDKKNALDKCVNVSLSEYLSAK